MTTIGMELLVTAGSLALGAALTGIAAWSDYRGRMRGIIARLQIDLHFANRRADGYLVKADWATTEARALQGRCEVLQAAINAMKRRGDDEEETKGAVIPPTIEQVVDAFRRAPDPDIGSARVHRAIAVARPLVRAVRPGEEVSLNMGYQTFELERKTIAYRDAWGDRRYAVWTYTGCIRSLTPEEEHFRPQGVR